MSFMKEPLMIRANYPDSAATWDRRTIPGEFLHDRFVRKLPHVIKQVIGADIKAAWTGVSQELRHFIQRASVATPRPYAKHFSEAHGVPI